MAFDPFDEFLRRMRRMFRDFEREFAEIDMGKVGREPKVSGFRIEIRDHGMGKPEVKVTRFGRSSAGIRPVAEELPAVPERRAKKTKPVEARPVTRTLETNVGKIERADEVVLTMQAPGVKKEDVEIRQLGNTVEIIGHKKTGEAYFGAFELPPDAEPRERVVEVKDGMLIVTIPRRRKHLRFRA